MTETNTEHNQATDLEIKDILIVGSIGKTTNQFVRIRQGKKGDIYIENRYKPMGPHFSYHASGEVHTVSRNQQGRVIHSQLGNGPPIAEFRGEVSLGAWVVYAPDLPIWKQLTPSEDRKTQLVLHFDMPMLSGNLSLTFWLFETAREDLVQSFLQNLGRMDIQVLGYLLVIDTNPCILIVAASV